MNVELGSMYQDSITGFKGVATGHVRYLNEGDAVLLEPRVIWDGKSIEGKWIPISRLEPAPSEPVAVAG